MKKILLLVCAVTLVISLLITGCSGKTNGQQNTNQDVETQNGEQGKIETITITVDSRGNATSATRGTNIVEAANELNKILEESNDNRRVKVEHSHMSAGGDDDFNKKFFLAWQSGGGADILCTGHVNVGLYAEGGYVAQLDEMIAKSEHKNTFDSIYSSLWDAAKYNGKIYGVPQDAEARPVYFRKDVLKKMGWSEDQINALPERIKSGEFTLQDLIALGKEAKDKGFVKWGVFHRTSNGPEFTMIVKDFGAKLYNNESGKLILDKKPVTEALKFFKSLTVDSKITPEGMTSMEWNNIHKSWLEGDVLFWFGGTWQWSEYQKVDYSPTLGKLSEDYLFENIGYALVPAANNDVKPMTLTQPYVYMINSKSKHIDLAFELIAIASKPQYNVKHALESGNLVISDEAAEQPEYQEQKFHTSVTYMLDYTTTQPNTPIWSKYTGVLFKAIQAVEFGKQSPEKAVEWMEEQLKNDIGLDDLEIIE